VTGAPTQTRARAARVRRRTTILTTVTVVSQDEGCVFKMFIVFDMPFRYTGTLSMLDSLYIIAVIIYCRAFKYQVENRGFAAHRLHCRAQ
jgi:hypothetical protein